MTPVSVFVGSTLDATENPLKGMQRSLFCVQVKLSQLPSPNPLSSGLYFLFLEKPSVESSVCYPVISPKVSVITIVADILKLPG